jgi:hypothetical protein
VRFHDYDPREKGGGGRGRMGHTLKRSKMKIERRIRKKNNRDEKK